LAALLPHLAVRSLLLVALARGVVALAVARGPVRQHSVWTATAVALLLLPGLLLVEPGLGLAVGPRLGVPIFGVGTTPEPGSVASLSAPVTTGLPQTEPTPGLALAKALADLARGVAPPWPLVAALWWVGMAVLGGRLLLQYAHLRRLVRRAAAVDGPPWSVDLAAAASRTGVTRAVRLVAHPLITSPTVLGVLRPAILLPPAAHEWAAARRQSVLRHELLHIRRGDPWAQLLFQVVCVIYWFNPWAWRAARWARVARECACDDRVVASGIGAADYARELLATAQHLLAVAPQRSGTLPGFASRSELRVRVCALLTERAAPGPVSGRWLAGLSLVAGLTVVLLAAVCPGPALAGAQARQLRLFYAADATAPAVDLLLDDQLVLANVHGHMGVSWTTSPTAIGPGPHRLEVRPSTGPADAGVRNTIQVEPGVDYLTFVLGRPGQMSLRTVADDLTLPSAGRQKVRVVHGAPGTGPFSVTIRELSPRSGAAGRALYRSPDLVFGEMTGYAEFASGPGYAVEQTIQGRRSPLTPHLVTQDGGVTFIVLTNPNG
jgi:beta-lactamase regulating signal transducer with metallopeptidase domain